MNKRYVFSVYKLTIRVYETIEIFHFSTFKEAKLFGKEYKEYYPNAQVVSVKEEKVHSTLSKDQFNVQ